MARYAQDNKKFEICGIKYKNCECFLEYTNFENDLNEIQMFMLKEELSKRV